MKNLNTQTINKVTICGKVVETNVRRGTTTTGKPYIGANMTVRVHQSYLGVDEVSDIPVSFFATQFTNKGTNNPAYENVTAIESLKTIQTHGEAGADIVRLRDSSTSLRENAFVSRSGVLIDGWQIDGRFANHGAGEETATFLNEIVVLDMKDEVDSEGETTGRLILKGGVVQWGEKLDVIEFVVEDRNLAAEMGRGVDVNSTIRVWGNIRVATKEEKRAVATSSWGTEAPAETSTRTVRELIVTGGTPIDDDDFAYDLAEIKKGFNARKAYRESLLTNARNTTSAAAAPAAAKKPSYTWEA